MNDDRVVMLPFPGRRARLVRKYLLASVLIALSILSSVAQVMPQIISMFIPPSNGSSEAQQNSALHTSSIQQPGVSLPPGTIQYGSRNVPTFRQAMDSSISPRLISTSNASIYQTSFGTYSFNKSTPFLFTLRSMSGTLLTKASFFFVRSSAQLAPGVAKVTVATDSQYQVKYQVLLGTLIVGNLSLQVDFQASVRPKFTITFSEAPVWNLGDFSIVWATHTMRSWLKIAGSTPIDIGDVQNTQSLGGDSHVDVGPSADDSSWTDWLTTDWSDSPGAHLEAGHFMLGGISGKGHIVVFPTKQGIIDPTQVATSAVTVATGYSPQRKTFAYGGYYFLFWYDGNNIVYASSLNGITWSSAFSTGSGLLNYGFDVYNTGSRVALAWYDYSTSVTGDGIQHLLFKNGTVIGNSINLSPTRTVATLPQPYGWPPSVAIGTDGAFWAAGIWYDSPTTYNYNVWIYRSTDSVSFVLSTNYLTESSGSRDEAIQLLPLSQGRLMSLTSHWCCSDIRWEIWNPVTTGSAWSSIQSYPLNLQTFLAKLNLFSAATTPDSFVHLIYSTGSSLGWAYYNITSGQWTTGPTLYSGSTIYPSISSDLMGNLYAFWMVQSSGVPTYLMYSSRQKNQAWIAPSQPFGSGSSITNANWLTATRLASKEVFLAWTNTGASPNKIFYGSIPLPSGAASAPPSQPWNRFDVQTGGEQVQSGNGLLGIGHMDISVQGRGLDLAITRLYLQPFTLLQGAPFNYESSPYANLGNGWQLGLPWVGSLYYHSATGAVAPLAWSNYTTTMSGTHLIKTWTLSIMNDNYVLTQTQDTDTSTNITTTTYKLVTIDGTTYRFNNLGLVTTIVDRTGQNQISFSYTPSNTISTITDTLLRQATFSYTGGYLTTVSYGGQSVSYGYSGSNLVSATDSLGRTIRFSYSPQSNWLIQSVTYPTGGNSTYVYGSVNIGTDATNYYVTLQKVYTTTLVRSTSYSYQITDGTVTYTSVANADASGVIQGYTNTLSNPLSSSSTTTILNGTGFQMKKTQIWLGSNGHPVQMDVYSGGSVTRTYYTRANYDLWGNQIYGRDPTGHETFASYANTDTQYTFQSPGNLTTTTNGKQLFDDFNLPSLDSSTWIQGGSGASLSTSTSSSLLTLQAATSSSTWQSNWVRTTGTFSYPFYAEVQTSLNSNPGITTLDADFQLSPQVTATNGNPYQNPDLLRFIVNDGASYVIVKCVSGICSTVYNSNVPGGAVAVSWKIILTDQNTLTVYLNRGSGFSPFYSTTSLGLSNNFAPSYAYLAFYNINNAIYSASFDYVGLSSSNWITVNGLQAGQRVELYDSNSVLQSSATSGTPSFVAGWNSQRQNAGSGSTTQSLTVCNVGGGCKAGDTIIVNYWQCCTSGQSLLSVTDNQGNPYSEIVLANGANPNNVMADVWGTISISADTNSLTITATYPDTTHYRAIFVQQYRNTLAFGATHFTGQSNCATTSESLTTTRLNSLVAVAYDIGFMTGMTQPAGPTASNDFSYSNGAGWGLFLWDSVIPNIGPNTWSWSVSGCNSGYQSIAIELISKSTSSVTLDGTQTVFPYASLTIYETDGRTIQSVSSAQELWGGSVYSYKGPYRSGGLTRTSTGFVKSNSIFVDGSTPPGAVLSSDGGDSWLWFGQPYATVLTGQPSHIGLSVAGEHQHYFTGATTPENTPSGSFLIQYIYIPSISVPSEIMLQFHDTSGSWEHRAYWGSNSLGWGTDGTVSRRNMGPLPTARDSWVELIVKTDDVGIGGLNIDGLAYSLFNGGVYWAYSALGGPGAGTITITSLLAGQKVEVYDSNLVLKLSGTVPSGGSSIALNIYSAGINVFPFTGYVKIYSSSGGLQYSSPLMSDISGGDTYFYNQPSSQGPSGFLSASTPYVVGGLPSGATAASDGGDSWSWIASPAISGTQSHISAVVAGEHQHYFYGSTSTLSPTPGYSHVQYVYIPSSSVPSEIMLQFHDSSGSWEHRAYWGCNCIAWGTDNTVARRSMGPIPAARNSWIMLAVKTDDVGTTGLKIDGLAYTLYNGGIYWDYSALGNGFSNNFNMNPVGGSIHNLLIGRAEYQNATSLIEVYYSRDSIGNSLAKSLRYDSTSGTRWISATRTYDAYGNPTSLTDARGNVAYYSYSTTYGSAYLTNQTQLAGAQRITTLFGYNFINGRQLWVYDPRHFNTTYQYDSIGRLTTMTYPTGDFTAYAYNDPGNYVDVTNENGWKTRQIYDGLSRLIVMERFMGNTAYSNQTTTYNWQDNAASTIDSLGNAIQLKYDYFGRITSTTKPDGTVTRLYYNDMASSVRYVDENLNSRCNFYDRLGRLLSVIEYADQNCNPLTLAGYTYVSNYSYDQAGNLKKTTTADSMTTSFVYNNLNRLTAINYPDGTSLSYTYDDNGNLIRRIDQNNLKTLYSYDSANRPNTATYCGASVASNSYTYDPNGNLLTLQNQNGTISYTYDSRNRMLTEAYNVNPSTRTVVDLGCSGVGGSSTATGGVSKTYTVTFGYNGETLQTITYPTISTTNVAVQYSYDSIGRVVSLTQAGTTTSYAQLSYYTNDKLRGILYGNGLVGNYTYDNLARPLTITLKNGATALLSLTYGYNSTGTVASVTGQVNQATVNEQYRYDPLQRLTNATVTSQSTTTTLWYQYDNVGNRRIQSMNGVLTTYSYNLANNQLTGYSTTGTSVAYSYDAIGSLRTKNVTTSGTTHWTYNWDVTGHLLQANTDSGTQGVYAYDGKGRLVESLESGPCGALEPVFFAYLGTETLFKTIQGCSSTDYVYAAGMRIARLFESNGSFSGQRYYHNDALGSVRLITSSSQSVIFADGYQPFGQDNGTPIDSSPIHPEHKFAGKPWSSALGLYYFYQRWYDPSTGRFISRDSYAGQLSSPQTLNGYAYVTNSPLNYRDPSGRFLQIAIAAAAGGIAAWGWCAYQAGSAAALFTPKCGIAAAIGAASGALAGATFGMSLLGESTVGLVAWGAITGAAYGGLLTFDLNGIGYDLTHDSNLFETPTLEHLEWDLFTGALSGGIGGLFGTKIGPGIVGAGKALGEALLAAVFDPLARWIGKQLGMVNSIRGAVVSGVTAIGSAVVSGVTAIGSAAVSGVTAIGSAAVSGVTTIGSAAVSGVTTIGSTALNLVSNIFSW